MRVAPQEAVHVLCFRGAQRLSAGTIRYRDIGSGPTVVFVHGAGRALFGSYAVTPTSGNRSARPPWRSHGGIHHRHSQKIAQRFAARSEIPR